MRAQDLEAFYSAVHGEEGNVPAFPSSYPQGALLGSVDVVDCVEVRRALRKMPRHAMIRMVSPCSLLKAYRLYCLATERGCVRMGAGASFSETGALSFG